MGYYCLIQTLNTIRCNIELQLSIKIMGAMFAVLAALVSLGIASAGLTSSAIAQEGTFLANLSADQEVPPVENTEATGTAEFMVMEDSIEYSVNASNIEGVTAIHIHSGKPTENGPVVVTLAQYDPPTSEVSINGSITADMLEGDMAGQQLSDLTAAMSDENAYVNVHTEQNPDGEIRGDLKSGAPDL